MTHQAVKRAHRVRINAAHLNAVAQRIVASARAHFFAHGFRGVTMDDLAGELGMSKKTVYAHFPSKIDLVQAVLLAKLQSVENDLDTIIAATSADALGALHELLACVQRHTEEIRPPFVRDMRRETPELFKLVEERRRHIIQRYFGRIFDQGRRAGIVRKDVSTEVIVEILLGAVQAIMNPAKMEELGLEPKTGYAAITSVILEGVMSKKQKTR